MWRSRGSIHRQTGATCVDQIIKFNCNWHNRTSVIAIRPWKNRHVSADIFVAIIFPTDKGIRTQKWSTSRERMQIF